jgi:2-polyprenyl-6-methoxyphenol hydroxylase-like FAD-dependent oxidoreductase
MPTPPPILIAGAGPTGLVLALSLARQGLHPRIIDKAPAAGQTSRALAVQARTLEFYHQLDPDLAADTVAAGIKLDHLDLRRPSGHVARVPLGDFGKGLSPYPFVLSLPQDDHERLLIDHLTRAGVTIERNTELTALVEIAEGFRATLKTPTGEEQFDAAYLCGCDGAKSFVRRALDINFPGGTYDQVFYVADAFAPHDADAFTGVSACVSPDGFVLVFPVRRTGALRLIGIVPREHENDANITFDTVAPDVVRHTGLHVETVNWFSTYHVHHRVAEAFRKGRAFLCGDAAHIHSPAGGQGMNTGIGDAYNLAWKLAAVATGRAAEKLLDTYEPERLAFARVLVATTDRFFQLVAGRNRRSWLARGYLLPALLPRAARLKRVQRFMFRGISQTQITYKKGPLTAPSSRERDSTLRPGDRLPWVSGAPLSPSPGIPGEGRGEGLACESNSVISSNTNNDDNFAPLRSLDWQLHTYSPAPAPLRTFAATHHLPLHEFPSTPAAITAGLLPQTAYLIRPDGHLALITPAADPSPIDPLLTAYQITPRPTPALPPSSS